MKKLTILITVAAFLSAGALFHSCKKDEMKQVNSTENLALKVDPTCAFPIMMGQYTQIGCANISFDLEGISLCIDLDVLALDGYIVTESHLYYGDNAPTLLVPGKFPYFLDETMCWSKEETFEWCIDYPRYFALHLQLEKEMIDPDTGLPVILEETAWLLTDNGEPFMNHKGQIVGWGKYFLFTINNTPQISDLELLVTEPGIITGDQESGFEMCLNEDPLFYYYFDTYFTIDLPLEEGIMNAFTLGTVTDQNFWDYWDAKGVNASASSGWELIMWQIINGDAPIFYLVWDGFDYSLIDGLQYLTGQGENPLRISGDYPAGTYTFSGTVKTVECATDPITISLTVGPCE